MEKLPWSSLHRTDRRTNWLTGYMIFNGVLVFLLCWSLFLFGTSTLFFFTIISFPIHSISAGPCSTYSQSSSSFPSVYYSSKTSLKLTLLRKKLDTPNTEPIWVGFCNWCSSFNGTFCDEIIHQQYEMTSNLKSTKPIKCSIM